MHVSDGSLPPQVLHQPRHDLDVVAGPVPGVELRRQDPVPGVPAGLEGRAKLTSCPEDLLGGPCPDIEHAFLERLAFARARNAG